MLMELYENEKKDLDENLRVIQQAGSQANFNQILALLNHNAPQPLAGAWGMSKSSDVQMAAADANPILQ